MEKCISDYIPGISIPAGPVIRGDCYDYFQYADFKAGRKCGSCSLRGSGKYFHRGDRALYRACPGNAAAS